MWKAKSRKEKGREIMKNSTKIDMAKKMLRRGDTRQRVEEALTRLEAGWVIYDKFPVPKHVRDRFGWGDDPVPWEFR